MLVVLVVLNIIGGDSGGVVSKSEGWDTSICRRSIELRCLYPINLPSEEYRGTRNAERQSVCTSADAEEEKASAIAFSVAAVNVGDGAAVVEAVVVVVVDEQQPPLPFSGEALVEAIRERLPVFE